MAKAVKSDKSKIGGSFKIDPETHKKAVKKCHEESIATGNRVTLSSKIEELLKAWVEKK